MANKHTDRAIETWGTWEELLLACAVNRHGTDSWDAVAIEIQKRSPVLHHLTSHVCKKKYLDLKRRFMTLKDHNDVVSDQRDDDDGQNQTTIPLLDELRKLRVAELKREVELYDLSIVSLQLKVKRLKEEQEQSLREDENKSDLEKSSAKGREETKDGDVEPYKVPPGFVVGKYVSGEASNRENQSFNESNWTDPKIENPESMPEAAGEKRLPVETGTGELDPAAEAVKRAGEDSCNGSSESIAKESAAATPARESEKQDSERGPGESPELLESVAESKGGGESSKESNSDVQSWASLSKEDPPEPAIKRVSVNSHPLVRVLEMVQSHRLGSVFARRLASQETPNYRSLIRQHVDLETVRTRLEEGWYADCHNKFFRDLLLLCNNAIVFFGNKTSESKAAVELRQLISKEMAHKNPKSGQLPKGHSSLPPWSSKPDPEASDSLHLKPKLSGPIFVCRKRSSIAAKASASFSGTERKREQATKLLEETPVLDQKRIDRIPINAEERRVTKKRSVERFVSARNSNKNSKNRTNISNSKNSDNASNAGLLGKGRSSSESSEPISGKNTTTASASNPKKRSASNFTYRTKRSSLSNSGSVLDTLKLSIISPDNSKGGGSEQRKSGGLKGDGRKDQRKSSDGKPTKEQGSPAKRSVGRPPKTARAPPSPPSVVPAKRNREGGEVDAVASRQPKKRARR